MRLGGGDDDDDHERGPRNGNAAQAYGDDDSVTTARKRMLIYAAIAILMFFMLKNATTNNYEKSAKDYYVSIGREDKAREFYTKKDLEDEKVQLIAAVERHEKQLQANQEEITALKQAVEELKKKHGNLGDGGNA